MSARGGKLPVSAQISWPLTWLITLIAIELALIVGYLSVSTAKITDPLPTIVYPMVWINVSLLAIATTQPSPSSPRRRWIAAGITLAYGLVLFVLGGVISPGHLFHGHVHATGISIQLLELPPGWNPAVFYGGAYLSIAVIPYKVIGYIALGYLVFQTILDVSGSAILGVTGLFSCVSCTWPLIGAIVTSAFGGAIGTLAMTHSYTLSTLVFLSAVGLLYWQPTPTG